MPSPDYERYDYAIAQAIKYERLRDPFNAFEWASMALHWLPDDPVALRHKEKAASEIGHIHSAGNTDMRPTLSLSDQEKFDRLLLIAESFLANGANRLAARELSKARKIAPNHPLLRRLEHSAGITEEEPPTPDTATTSSYDDSAPAPSATDRTILIRRLAVARSLAKTGHADKARAIANSLLASFGPLPEINDLINSL